MPSHKHTHNDEPYGGPQHMLFAMAAGLTPSRYLPARGDLVLVPGNLSGIVTHVLGSRASVILGNGFWASFDLMQLQPYLNDEPGAGVANFAGVLPDDLESFAVGFRIDSKCDADVDLVNVGGRSVCPVCAFELAEAAADDHGDK
jgi:hypothetical protein